MKTSLKFLPILGITLLLASCGGSPASTGGTVDAPVPTKTADTPTVTPEQKDLSDKMVQVSKDLSVTQVVGNTAFKSYDKLSVKYGTDAKSLTQTKEFNGKDGFVVLDGLKPETEYTYDITSGTTSISKGTVRTQKK